MLVTFAAPDPTVGLASSSHVVALRDVVPAIADHERAGGSVTMNDVIEHWADWGQAIRALAVPDSGTPIADVRLLAPIPRTRRNPFLLAGNYMDHVVAGERASGIPLTQRKTAIFFTKPTGTLSGPTDDIEVDTRLTEKLDYETELVIVIGKGGRDITRDDAMEHVFGYTIGNDVSARDIQRQKPTTDYLRGKGLDTFFPTGPGIVLRDDIPDYRVLRLRTYVNDEVKQDATLDHMIRDVPEIIYDLSRGLTLEPGDLIATGTPSGVQSEKDDPVWLADGDVVVSEIERLGRLVNRVRKIA